MRQKTVCDAIKELGNRDRWLASPQCVGQRNPMTRTNFVKLVTERYSHAAESMTRYYDFSYETAGDPRLCTGHRSGWAETDAGQVLIQNLIVPPMHRIQAASQAAPQQKPSGPASASQATLDLEDAVARGRRECQKDAAAKSNDKSVNGVKSGRLCETVAVIARKEAAVSVCAGQREPATRAAVVQTLAARFRESVEPALRYYDQIHEFAVAAGKERGCRGTLRPDPKIGEQSARRTLQETLAWFRAGQIGN